MSSRPTAPARSVLAVSAGVFALAAVTFVATTTTARAAPSTADAAHLVTSDSIAAPDVAFSLRPDYNGDGRGDLAVGAPGESLDPFGHEGAVNVIYGSASGLTAAENELWSQDSPGIVGEADGSDGFGHALGWADFDGDGFDDLAVGVPGEFVGGHDAGAVNVIYGSAAGLTATGNQQWSQDSAGVLSDARKDELFGTSLVGRDFNDDGYGDLAIGAIGEGAPRGAGAVTVLYGSAAGLIADGNQFIRQVKGKPQRFDRFGEALGAGDFDNDGYPDLAVGADMENVGGADDAGAVNVMYGSAGGVREQGSQIWHQGRAGVLDDPEPEEWLGRSLSVADFDGDGFADLVAGIIWENVASIDSAGAAMVLYGSATGLVATGNQLWHQDVAGILGSAEPFDTVGDVVAGDFDGDGFADLAIGYHGEDLGSIDGAGAVNVIYGTSAGLAAAGNQLWTQDSPGVEDLAEAGEGFGSALTRADFDGDGFFDLVIGVPRETVLPDNEDGGAVNVLYGTASGLSAAGDQVWNQNSPGVLDDTESFDGFGSALSER